MNELLRISTKNNKKVIKKAVKLLIDFFNYETLKEN